MGLVLPAARYSSRPRVGNLFLHLQLHHSRLQHRNTAGPLAGLRGFEAMAAMLMFGWSKAVLAVVAVKLHGLDT